MRGHAGSQYTEGKAGAAVWEGSHQARSIPAQLGGCSTASTKYSGVQRQQQHNRSTQPASHLEGTPHLKCWWMTSLKYSGVCCRWSSMAHLMVEGLRGEQQGG